MIQSHKFEALKVMYISACLCQQKQMLQLFDVYYVNIDLNHLFD